MHLGAVLNHPQGLHVHEVTTRPSAHHYRSEMHLDMIVHGPVIGSGISTERAIGVIGFYGGRNSMHNMSFPCHNPCHGPEALCRFIGILGDPGKEPFHCHKVPLMPALLTNIFVLLFEFFKQKAAVIHSVDGLRTA